MLSRRDLVGKLAAGTAAVCVVGVAGSSLASTRRDSNTGAGHGEGPADGANPSAAEGPVWSPIVDADVPATLSAPAPWDLVQPLAVGSAVAHGWRVAGLTGAVDGSCVLTLQNERGRAHRVHLCRNDGRPQGLVYTKRFDLVVMNEGEGDLPTEESLAQAVAELGHVLAANEGDRQHEALVTALLPQAERLRLFAGPVDRRLR
jgi:hypothetical protein